LRIALGKWETASRAREAGQTWSFRGSKSRNKVSVGEPAEGSLTYLPSGGAVGPAPAKTAVQRAAASPNHHKPHCAPFAVEGVAHAAPDAVAFTDAVSEMSRGLVSAHKLNNFQQRISWLSHR